jgi:hypothetical protein
MSVSASANDPTTTRRNRAQMIDFRTSSIAEGWLHDPSPGQAPKLRMRFSVATRRRKYRRQDRPTDRALRQADIRSPLRYHSKRSCRIQLNCKSLLNDNRAALWTSAKEHSTVSLGIAELAKNSVPAQTMLNWMHRNLTRHMRICVEAVRLPGRFKLLGTKAVP